MTTLQSPVKHFPGEVELHDPLTLPMVIAWEKSILAMTELPEGSSRAEQNQALLPGIFACVIEWRLSNFPKAVTVENFPGAPVAARMQLVAWLIDEIMKIYNGEDQGEETTPAVEEQ